MEEEMKVALLVEGLSRFWHHLRQELSVDPAAAHPLRALAQSPAAVKARCGLRRVQVALLALLLAQTCS